MVHRFQRQGINVDFVLDVELAGGLHLALEVNGKGAFQELHETVTMDLSEETVKAWGRQVALKTVSGVVDRFLHKNP